MLNQDDKSNLSIVDEKKYLDDNYYFSMKYGFSIRNTSIYDSLSTLVNLKGFLLGFNFEKETKKRRLSGTWSISDLDLDGTKIKQNYDLEVALGFPIYKTIWYSTLIQFSGLVLGGIDFELNEFQPNDDSDAVPDSPSLDFHLGMDFSMDFIYPIAKISNIFLIKRLGLGLGLKGGFIQRQVELEGIIDYERYLTRFGAYFIIAVFP